MQYHCPLEAVELFEPKLPPINLWCLPSASWFYRNKIPQPIEPKLVQVKCGTTNHFLKLYQNAKENK